MSLPSRIDIEPDQVTRVGWDDEDRLPRDGDSCVDFARRRVETLQVIPCEEPDVAVIADGQVVADSVRLPVTQHPTRRRIDPSDTPCQVHRLCVTEVRSP